MPDREKVIKGLECCKETCGIGDCTYWNGSITDGSCMIKLHADALSLLKEQEPVEPEVYYVGTDKYKFYRCPVCNTAWYYKGNYCLGCGRAVKWND